ncbi:hypothetical protein BFP76_02955 [Amylibacter kogurei]|uniref:Excalibur calcium-binding domain-containing protein n=1 Tax=Paramylibacter kogurei TaxID=1889778 RepID=A0A2G5K599_9RHOB|nr:hypothetical protein [Amylibacter kogurei]PIB24203.1 hypothetical protein BFP76_02955 [Amylibacter kogurei]
MRLILGMTITAGLLAACSPPPPTPDDYFESVTPQSPALSIEEQRLQRAEQAQAQRELAAENTLATTPSNDASVDNLLEQAENELNATDTPAPAPLPETDRSTISNSQDFEAVTQRETIETDAAKLEELKRTYTVFDAKELPQKQGGTDLASYAQANKDRTVGRSRYRRNKKDYTANNCNNYADRDLAQVTFLLQGGPRKDPLKLDADGDGFACSWTPYGYFNSRSASAQ